MKNYLRVGIFGMKKISIDLDEIGSATRVGEDERENQEIQM